MGGWTRAAVAVLIGSGFAACEPLDGRDVGEAADPVALEGRAPEVVVARVDGRSVFLSEVQRLAVGQDRVTEPEDFTPDSEGYDEVLAEIVDQRILSAEARERGLQRSAEFRRRARISEERILGNLLVEDYLERSVTDAALRELYEQQLALREPEPQVRGRHLVTETREEAEAARARVEAGEDFADVAAEVSLDASTAVDGGTLDWFTRRSFATEFTDAAFATGEGNLSPPVETEDGWHVILVEEVREDSPPTFEQLRDELATFLTYDTLEGSMGELREGAEVTYVGDETDEPEEAPEGG